MDGDDLILEGYIYHRVLSEGPYYLDDSKPKELFNACIQKVSWERFLNAIELTEAGPAFAFHEGSSCSVVSKNRIYFINIQTTKNDPDAVYKRERLPAKEIEEFAFDPENRYLGLPHSVFCHLIGQIKTELQNPVITNRAYESF